MQYSIENACAFYSIQDIRCQYAIHFVKTFAIYTNSYEMFMHC